MNQCFWFIDRICYSTWLSQCKNLTDDCTLTCFYSCILFPGFRLVFRLISLPVLFCLLFLLRSSEHFTRFLASLTSHKQKIMKASLSGDSTEFPTSFFSCGLRLFCSYSQWTESIRSLHPLLAATFIILENSLCFKCCFSCHLFHNKS